MLTTYRRVFFTKELLDITSKYEFYRKKHLQTINCIDIIEFALYFIYYIILINTYDKKNYL